MQLNQARQLGAAISTPRLLLEPRLAGHAEAFFAPLQTDEALYRWISMDKPASLEALRQRWERAESRLSADQRFAWLAWAVRRRADGQYLGQVDAEITEALEASNIGYFFFSPFWGQGYASEATLAATEALAQRGVRRFVATVSVGNSASARVLRKAGFVFSRLLPGNDVIRGLAVDDEEYVKVVAGTAPASG